MPDLWTMRSGVVVPLMKQPFSNEDELQRLLAATPTLLTTALAGDSNPDHWVLIDREVRLSSPEGTTWSADHVFIGSDLVPTLVEVKLAFNPESRRAVIGQALDYVATLIAEGVDVLQARFTDRCARDGIDPLTQLEPILSAANLAAVDDLWARVDDHLRAHKLRVAFVGDQISPAVRRVIEFLNRETANVEVIAVALDRHGDDELLVIAPTVYGRTIETQNKAPAVECTPDEWISELDRRTGPDQAQAIRVLMEAVVEAGGRAWANKGDLGAMILSAESDGADIWLPLYYLWWDVGAVWFQWLKPEFFPPEERRRILERLNEAPGLNLDTSKTNGRPQFDLAALKDPTTLKSVVEATTDFALSVRAANGL